MTEARCFRSKAGEADVSALNLEEGKSQYEAIDGLLFDFLTWSLAQIRCLRGIERGFTTDSRRIGDHVRKDIRIPGYCGGVVASRGGVTAVDVVYHC